MTKYLVEVYKESKADVNISYVVDAEDEEEARNWYELRGLTVYQNVHYDVTKPEFYTYVKSVKKFKKSDDPKRFMILAFRKDKRPPIAYEWNLTRFQVDKKVEELKAFLDTEKITNKDFDYEFISVMEQDWGARYYPEGD